MELPKVPVIRDLMDRSFIAEFGKDARLRELLEHVEKTVDEKFFGTAVDIDITKFEKKHVQMVVWLYRQNDWLANIREGMLVLRDPNILKNTTEK